MIKIFPISTRWSCPLSLSNVRDKKSFAIFNEFHLFDCLAVRDEKHFVAFNYELSSWGENCLRCRQCFKWRGRSLWWWMKIELIELSSVRIVNRFLMNDREQLNYCCSQWYFYAMSVKSQFSNICETLFQWVGQNLTWSRWFVISTHIPFDHFHRPRVQLSSTRGRGLSWPEFRVVRKKN